MNSLSQSTGVSEASSHRVIQILLVEDEAFDAKLIKRAALNAKITNPIVHVESGEAALSHLDKTKGTEQRPNLILLDLQLPGISGHDVLRRIKANPDTATIPTVILTSSTQRVDIDAAYIEGAAAYIAKPVGLEGSISIAEAIQSFWISLTYYSEPPGD